MAQGNEAPFCPRGHRSSEADFCSECGVRLGGSGESIVAERPSASVGTACPDCGTGRGAQNEVYCEICGYNYETGGHGEIPELAPAQDTARLSAAVVEETTAAEQSEAEPQGHRWQVLVEVAEGEPGAEGEFVPFAVDLNRPLLLLGRGDEARGIRPEILLAHDEAVSRRHALLLVDSTADPEVQVRDIGSSNGTRLNGVELTPLTDYPVRAGDVIEMGRRSRLQVRCESL